MDRLSERLVNIIVGYEDPFSDALTAMTGNVDQTYFELTDVPECNALGVALGAARTLGYGHFDIVIRRTTDPTKFNTGYYDARNDGEYTTGYHFTHIDFDLDCDMTIKTRKPDDDLT